MHAKDTIEEGARMRREEERLTGHYVCAWYGCSEPTERVRETASGYPVGYCVEHAEQAKVVFGDPPLNMQPHAVRA